MRTVLHLRTEKDNTAETYRVLKLPLTN
jgi:hypothetical protein